MAKQTAVEWLVEQMKKDSYQILFGKLNASIETIEQAKAMEKEQIINAYGDGQENGINCQKKLSNGDDCNIITALEYYNKTYNK